MTDKEEHDLEALLAETGSPIEEFTAGRLHGVPPALAELHRCILGWFVSPGLPVRLAAVADKADALGLEPTEAVDELTRVDLVHIDPEAGVVTVAYPFSGRATPHRVTLPGGSQVHAMCAIDALGIPAMLHQPATITSVDPQTGEAVRVDVAGTGLHWDPETLVVGVAATGTDTCCPVAQNRCPHVNFHTSPDAARAYWETQRATGVILTVPAATHLGARVFGALLNTKPMSDRARPLHAPLPGVAVRGEEARGN